MVGISKFNTLTDDNSALWIDAKQQAGAHVMNRCERAILFATGRDCRRRARPLQRYRVQIGGTTTAYKTQPLSPLHDTWNEVARSMQQLRNQLERMQCAQYPP